MEIPTAYLCDIDVDQALIEARDNCQEIWTRRALAGVSVGVEVADAAQSAAELLNTVNLLCAGRPEGKTKLAGILGRQRDDYQRALWYNLAGRGPLTIVSDLAWLVALLDRRMAIARLARRRLCKTATLRAPYVAPEPEAPLGSYPTDFALGEAWDGLALSR